MDLKKYIRSIPDYPKKGILFRDITTLIKNPQALKYTVDKLAQIKNLPVDVIKKKTSDNFLKIFNLN